MRILNTIEIKNTPEKIGYWLGDPSRAMEWMTSVTKTEIIKEVPGMVGTTFREFVEEDGRGTELRGVITGFVPEKRLAVHLEGDFNSVDASYTLEQKGEITQVSQDAEVHFKGLLRVISIVTGPIFKRKVTRQAQSEFAKLKELCERDVEYIQSSNNS
ncbi:MAG: SRPBCC family protein [Actinomycetota bacterium]|nr:SRPBCC family protein [Actinomycetota bacterium]